MRLPQPAFVLYDKVRRALAWVGRHVAVALRSLEALRKLAVNLFVTIVIGAIGYVTVAAALDDTTIVEPFSVPKGLADQGYAGTVVAQAVVDRIHAIGKEAASAKQMGAFAGESRFAEASSVSIPQSGMNIGTMVSLMRTILPLDRRRVTGDVTEQDTGAGKTLHLTLRLFRKKSREALEFSGASLPELYQQAAEAIVEEFDGYILASYLYERSGGDNRLPEPSPRLDELLARLIALDDPTSRNWNLTLQALVYWRTKRLDDADAVLRRFADVDFASAHIVWGLVLAAKGDMDGAIAKYRKTIEIDPKSAGAYVNWGNALSDKGEKDAAIAKYRKAIEINAKYAHAYNNWGNMLSDKGEKDTAVEKYRKAIEVDANYAYAYNGWGNVLSDRGNKDDAIEKYRKAIEIDPKYADPYNGWGNALREKGENDDAIEKYRKTIEIDPKYAHAYNGWGNALYDKGEKDDAIEKYRKAIEVDPRYANAYNGWGNALYDKGEKDQAIEQYRKAIEIDPKLAYAYNGWGNALLAKGETDSAIEKYRKAVDIDPKFVLAYNGWGYALFIKGETDSAIGKYGKAVEIDPKFVRAYRNWSAALEAKGDKDGAAEKLRQAEAIEGAEKKK